jgi:TolB-like protein/class 3 adenylate cyclase/Tfp pilus assembly protein PilF
LAAGGYQPRRAAMANDLQPKDELEIAHVLFIDVVGYSTRLINEQAAVVAELNQLVRETSHFRSAEAAGRLIRIPTGDGMALVFFNTPEAPVQCALEICQALRAHPDIHVRMGIHSGPVNPVPDVNDRPSVAGAGINIAQRIMDCADAGHILLSKRVAEDLSQYAHWQPKLHDLGEIEMKHGMVIPLVNLHGDGFGNPTVPSRMQQFRRRSSRRGIKARWWAGTIAITVALAVFGWFIYRGLPGRLGRNLAVAKSIAVLPFDNFSNDKQDSYFADGIQDDILTALSKISDLKVISRSSVMRYRVTNRDLRQIARDLDVANLLEGSVRRVGDAIRVTAQLIDARTDTHLWAEHYDRKTSDVFAIQSEVAENIATQLQATLSPAEKAAISVRPTGDLEAFDLFLQAKDLIRTSQDTPNAKETLLRAIRLLDEAIARDGKFALAYCWAATAHDNLYWFDYDHAATRLELAESCVRQALQLAPELGEARLAQALVFYHGHRDYARARQQLAIAQRSLPNNAEVCSLTGYIDRREGKWDDSLRNLQRAAELDPRNLKVLGDLSVLYDLLRRYDDKERLFDRAIAINPAQTDYWQLLRAETELEKGNLPKARQLFDQLPAQYDPDGSATAARINLFLYEGNTGAAQAALEACKHEGLIDGTGSLLPRSFFAGQISRARADGPRAIAAFNIARDEIGQKLRDDPDNGLLRGILCVINAGLGQKEESLSEGHRAVELRPISKDAVDGPVALTRLAMAYAWLGENDAAIERLAYLAKTPSGPDYGQLKFDPAWASLHGDARFVQIVDGLQPRSAPR